MRSLSLHHSGSLLSQHTVQDEVVMMKMVEKRTLSCVASGRKYIPSTTSNWQFSVVSVLLLLPSRCASGLSYHQSSSSSQNMAPPKNNDGTNGKKMMTKTKNGRFVSDGKAILQSFDPLEDRTNPDQVHTLILGTLPSEKSFGNHLSAKDIVLRGGDGPQNYGHPRNTFWNIVGSAFGFSRHRLPFKEQVRALISHGYAVWDVVHEGKRIGSLDCDLVKGSLTPTDIPKFILEHPNLTRLVFAANSAEVFCKKDVWASWLDNGWAETKATTNSTEGTTTPNVSVNVRFWIQNQDTNPDTFRRTNDIFGSKRGVSVGPLSSNHVDYALDDDDNHHVAPRDIELIVLPSTSPANAKSRPPEKEKVWHKVAYRLLEPPDTYICPGCQYHYNLHDDEATNNINADVVPSTESPHSVVTNNINADVAPSMESPYSVVTNNNSPDVVPSMESPYSVVTNNISPDVVPSATESPYFTSSKRRKMSRATTGIHGNAVSVREPTVADGLARHWFHDCPYREDWKEFKRSATSKKKKRQIQQKVGSNMPMTVVSADTIDPFDWYM